MCDFFLDKKERGNEINIRAIITAIDQANTTAGLTPVERKAVEEKQRELLVKVNLRNIQIFVDVEFFRWQILLNSLFFVNCTSLKN